MQSYFLGRIYGEKIHNLEKCKGKTDLRERSHYVKKKNPLNIK